MERAPTVDDFLRAPWGRYHAGRRHVVFACSPTLLGHASWGRPGVPEVAEMLRACEAGLRPDAVPHAWLVDLRALEHIDPSTFGQFVDYTRSNAAVLRAKITRQAQLRPAGMIGAIISGFSHIARLPYPERVFDEVDDALGWLGVGPELGRAVLAEVGAIRRAEIERDGFVGRLREALDREGTLALDTAARALGLAPRTLQRALGDAGTTYRAELRAFQLRRAEALLADARTSLTFVALESGFSSLQHFSTAFRRATGETPSAWRARRERAPG